jgi:hemerythrin-like metal-binding protein
MAKMEWTNALSVHVSAMDAEHKKLFSIIGKLHDGMAEGKGSAIIGEVLAELTSYTKTHFKHEEDLMQLHSYPGREAQKREHAAFVKQLSETQQEYQTGKMMISVSVLNFLNSWLKNHIMKTDFAYSSFFNGKGVK